MISSSGSGGLRYANPRLALLLYAGSTFSQIQTTFDSFHALRETIISRLLIDHVAIQVGVIASKARNGRLQTGEPLFDFAHVLLDATDIGADRPQSVRELDFQRYQSHRFSR